MITTSRTKTTRTRHNSLPNRNVYEDHPRESPHPVAKISPARFTNAMMIGRSAVRPIAHATPPMSFIHHPAFQSLGLPLLLTLVLTSIHIRNGAPSGGRWWAMSSAIALLLSFFLLPGFDWPATARTQKLPWVVLGATVLAFTWILIDAARPSRWMLWAMGSALWALACVWLAGSSAQWTQAMLGALAGAAVLALLLIARLKTAANLTHQASGEPADSMAADGVTSAAALTVASLGLAATAASDGSLLLAQLAMMLGVVTAVPGLWAWLKPASRWVIAPAALLPLGLSWLVIAYALAVPGPSASGRVSIMALAFVAPALVARSSWAARHPRWAPLLATLLAALPVAVAMAWLLLGDATPSGAEGLSNDVEDDLYYQPAWE